IRIELISLRVVVVCDALDTAALGRSYWFLDEVNQLPVEIIPRYLQQDLRSTIRINQRVLKILPSNMHMRHKAHDMGVLTEGERRLGLIVRLAGGNDQVSRNRACCDDTFFNWRLSEVDAYACPIFTSYTVSRVVHLKDQHRAFLDQFCLPINQAQWTHSG